MAKPVLTGIAPSGGRSIGGYVCYILGSAFRETPAVSAEGYVGGTWQDTVKVTFGGVDVGRVQVLGSDLLRFTVPMYQGDPADLKEGVVPVDVVVSNLNDSGAVISGEATTKADWFGYRHKDLTTEAHCTAVDRALVNALRRGVIDNVAFSTHPDYTLPDGVVAHEFPVAELPALYLVGPDVVEPLPSEEDDSAGEDADIEVKPGTLGREWRLRLQPKKTRVKYEVVGVSDYRAECSNLAVAFSEFVMAVKTLTVPVDPADSSAGVMVYPFAFDRDGYPSVSRRGELHQFSARIVLEDVLVIPARDLIVREGHVVYDGTDSDWRDGFPHEWLSLQKRD